jgi:hypothetical protein
MTSCVALIDAQHAQKIQARMRVNSMVATTNAVAFESLAANDHIQVTQRIKVGLKIWYTTVSGRVIRTERRRNGLHVDRNSDDKAFQDLIVLLKDGLPADETTMTLDEFTKMERLAN